MVLCGKSRAGPGRYWPRFDSRRVVSAEASAALHSAGDLGQDQAGTTWERSSEASLSFRRLISLSPCSLDSASGPSSHCSGLKPVCWPRVSSREMKFTGTPKKVLATLFLHASGKLDSSDFGQNVNARWSNSDLIDHLLLGEGLRRDPIVLEGSTELRKRSNHPEGILR